MKLKLLSRFVLLFFLSLTWLNGQPASTEPSDGGADISQGLTTISWDAFGSNSPNENYNLRLWENGQSTYAPYNGSGTMVYSEDGVSTESWDISSVTLKFNTEYYWYIQNTLDGDWYEYSFTVGAERVINTNTGNGYVNIQEAIEAATSEDVINVLPGLYTHNCPVKHNLTPVGHN